MINKVNKMNKNYLIFFTSFLMIIGGSVFTMHHNINQIIDFIGCSLLVLEALIFFWYGNNTEKEKKVQIILTIICIFLLSLGGFVQHTSIVAKLRIIFPAVVIPSIILLSQQYLNKYGFIRTFSLGIFISVIFIFIVSLICGSPVVEQNNEGFIKYGLNCGILYKNYFAATIFASFIGLFIYNFKFKKNYFDLGILAIELIMIFLSGSRGTWLILFLFLILMCFESNYNRLIKPILQKIKNDKRMLILSIVITLTLLFVLFKFISGSATYKYRTRGVTNYINYYKKDPFHLIFGNSEVAYRNSNTKYVSTIRSTIKGFDGSYEMGLINVLIKNGLIGILAYLICYINLIQRVLKNKKYRYIGLVIFIVLIISSLVETYVCNIHTIFGIYCYLLINGFIEIKSKNNDKYEIKNLIDDIASIE